MDISVWSASWRSWDEVRSLAQMAEESGWHGLWLADHLMLDSGSGETSDGDCHDAWAFLSALAASTSRIRLGSLVAPLTFRHPATLASTAVAIDEIARGRFVLGVGAGWQPNEHRAYDIPLGSRRERSDRLEEGCRLLRDLLDDARPHHEGAYFTVRGAPRRPRPPHRIPLLVGGKGKRRTLRTVARYAQEWNGWCDAALVRDELDALGRHCEAAGRDPATIRCSVNAFLAMDDDPSVVERLTAAAGARPVLSGPSEAVLDQLTELGAAGVDEVVVVDWNLDDAGEREDMLGRFAADVVGHVHA